MRNPRHLVGAFCREERPAGERHPAAVVDDALAHLPDGCGLPRRARIKNARPPHAAFLRHGVPAAVDEASHLRSGYAARAPRAASGRESGVVGAGRLEEEPAGARCEDGPRGGIAHAVCDGFHPVRPAGETCYLVRFVVPVVCDALVRAPGDFASVEEKDEALVGGDVNCQRLARRREVGLEAHGVDVPAGRPRVVDPYPVGLVCRLQHPQVDVAAREALLAKYLRAVERRGRRRDDRRKEKCACQSVHLTKTSCSLPRTTHLSALPASARSTARNSRRTTLPPLTSQSTITPFSVGRRKAKSRHASGTPGAI